MRSKFQEAEAHRNRVRAEMEQLSSSNDEEKIKLSRVQAERTLSDLVERRNALERKSSEHAVYHMEVEAEIAKLQDAVSGAQEAFESLTGEIEEMEQELKILSTELTRLEAAARECKQQLNECEQQRVQEEEEETALRDEIEAKRESIRLQSGKLTANFKKYGQGALAEKYRNESRAGEWTENLTSLKVGDPSEKIDERKKGLESCMERERVSVQREVRAMVGDEQLSRLEEDTEVFLKAARYAEFFSL